MGAHRGTGFRRCFGKTGRDLVLAGGGRVGRADGAQSLQCDPQRGIPSRSRLGGLPMPLAGVWAQRCLRAAEAEEPGRRGVRWAGRPSGLCPPLQPSPRTVTSTHFRGPCPGRGCRNHHPGQTLGPSCWRFNHCHNPNHTQAETPTPSQESCVQGLPQGHAGREDERRRADRWGLHVRPPQGATRTGGEPSCQHGA